ncbi:MAG: FAD-dependent thymidylate synthase [Prevotellaceae bacterium]|nr:FAD-dependent thymidylate synthase [Candidatus Faecinaster equi]
MEVKAALVTNWKRVVNAARKTSGKSAIDHDPQQKWRYKALISEHSPIRLLEFDIDISGVRQWVTVHLVRHFLGIEKFVHSQREDRRDLGGISRDDLPQGTENDMQYTCNAQALINVSRKRLCLGQPSPETRSVWEKVRDEIISIDPDMGRAMVKECVYRGFCPEMKCCGYCFTDKYKKELEEYRKGTTWDEINNNK